MLSSLVEKRILAVDWDERDVRVVHASVRKNQCRVLSVQSFVVPQDVGPGNTEVFGKLLREFLDHEGISTRSAVVDIPRHQATVKLLKGLPPARPEDLPGVIAMQFERELSFPASQALIDFAEPMSDPQNNTHSAVVAAVQNDVLKDYVGIFRAAGLKLERVGLRPYANRTAVNALLDAGRHEQVLFVDVGPAFTEIDVISDGQLVFTRAASVHVPRDALSEPASGGPVRMSEPTALEPDQPIRLSGVSGPGGSESGLSKVVNTLVVEVVRSIEAYRADEPGATVTHVVIGGGTGVEETLAEALRDRFDMTAELFNPAVYFGWDADRGAAASGFAAALGLVVWQGVPGASHFDFLHPKKVVTRTEKQLKKLPTAAGVAAMLILVVGIAYWVFVAPQKTLLASLDHRIEQARENEAAMKKLRKLINDAKDIEANQIVWLDELHDILLCLPDNEEMVLEDIDMRQKDRRIVLKVRARSRETLTDAVDDLQEFRLPERKGKHYKAELGTTRSRPGKYPVSGKIDVTVEGKRLPPDL